MEHIRHTSSKSTTHQRVRDSILTFIFRRSWIIAILSLFWLLMRTGTKPARIVYPCQQTAQNNLAIFGLPTLAFFFHKFSHSRRFRRKITIYVLLTIIVSFTVFHFVSRKKQSTLITPVFSQTGKSKVVWVQNTAAVAGWNNHTWETTTNQALVTEMADNALMELTNQPNVNAAWTTLFKIHNGGNDYVAGEKIAIKINNNNICDDATPINHCPSITVIKAILDQLINKKGVRPQDITVYDVSRGISEYERKGIAQISPLITIGAQNDCSSQSVNGAQLANDLVNAKYLINMPLLRNHGMAGVTLSFKNHLGSTCNPAAFHNQFFVNSTANTLVALNNNTHIKNKTILIVGDGLFGLKSGGPWANPDSSYGITNPYPSSLFFSTDPVAIDSVMTDYLVYRGSYVDSPADARTYMRIAAQMGLGNFDSNAGSMPNPTYSAIDIIKCQPNCPGTTPQPTPTPGPTTTPTKSPTQTPIPTPSNSPTPLSEELINIAPNGTGIIWSGNSTPNANTNAKSQVSGLSDGKIADIDLNGGADDMPNAYEGAGILFQMPISSIVRIEYINGTFTSDQNGIFTANFQLQYTLDGSTWISTNWTAIPQYPYSLDAGGKTFTWDKLTLHEIRGIRIVGQVHTPTYLTGADSWHAHAAEIRIYSPNVSVSPTPTSIPSPILTATPFMTPIPKPADANGDGMVNDADYAIWLSHYGQHANGKIYGDFDLNGNVDGQDFILWLKGYEM